MITYIKKIKGSLKDMGKNTTKKQGKVTRVCKKILRKKTNKI